MYTKKYDYESLRNYWLWYYHKYFPSSKKLKQKLLEKSWDIELSNKVYDSISHLIDDKAVINSKINLYLFRNKNINYIKTKLISSLFDKDMVLSILENRFLIRDKSLLDKKSILNKVKNYKNSWKSIMYIKKKLIETKQDEKVVFECINEVFKNWEDDIILQEIEKLKNRYDNNKIIKKLISKWFRYSDIRKYI